MPRFKSVSFPGAPHPVALKFGNDDSMFAQVSELSSAEVREKIGCDSFAELLAKSDRAGKSPHAFIHDRLDKALGRPEVPRPYSGWPEGSLVRTAAARELVREARACVVLDPFAGRADYAISAAQLPRVRSLYCEVSPVFRFIAESRASALLGTAEARESAAAELAAFAAHPERESRVSRFESEARSASPEAMLVATRRARSDDAGEEGADVAAALEFLQRLRSAIDELSPVASALAGAAVVEALPRTAADLTRGDFVREYRRQLETAAAFLSNEDPLRAPAVRIADDARSLSSLQPLEIDCVVTNPPSLNFASYATPVAMWFFGARRLRPRKLRTASEGVEAVRQLLGRDGKKVASSIAADVAKLERENERMARIGANYFADMAEAIAAIISQMTLRAVFAIDVVESSVAGVAIETPAHWAGMLGAFGFRLDREVAQFRVLRR